jgi:hypothetical protein
MPSVTSEVISGKSLQAILVAYPEFVKSKVDIEKYKVAVKEFAGELHVAFWDADRPTEPTDNRIFTFMPSIVEFEVVLDPSTLTILRAGLSR